MGPRLDFMTLRVFVAVAHTRNITRAGEIENLAASAVSKRMVDLEHMVGTPLLYRMPRGVELTPAGEALLRHARHILNSADRLVADLGDFAEGIRGDVRLAVNASSAAEFLPADLLKFTGLYPQVNVVLQEANTGWILEAVADGKFDIGLFAGTESGFAEVEVTPYREDSFVLVVQKGHRLAERSSVAFEETLDELFVGLEEFTAWSSTLTNAASATGKTIKYRFRLRNTLSIFQMVGAGLGVFIAPLTMARAISPAVNLQIVALEDPWARRNLSIATRGQASLGPAARKMLEVLTSGD